MVDLLNACLRDEMARDPRIVVFGEDVADVSREQHLGKVKGKGGVFKVTWGLQREFGGDRVYNSPLAEANIVGRAIGHGDARLQARGRDPVLRLHLAGVHADPQRARDDALALEQRVQPPGRGARRRTAATSRAAAIYHSQTGASLFTHMPGLRVVCPSTALDANGLLRTAIRCDDPVIFLEHKHLYRQTYNKAPYPGPNFMIPFGKAKVVRPGPTSRCVTYGAMVQRALVAAKEVAEAPASAPR